jgi:hypothetical protein
LLHFRYIFQFRIHVHVCFDSIFIVTLFLTIPTFQEAHPSWSHSSDSNSRQSNGKGAERRINANSAVASEQDLHRIAAARQLETLERIEEGHSSAPDRTDDLLLLPNIIDESYIPILSVEDKS